MTSANEARAVATVRAIRAALVAHEAHVDRIGDPELTLSAAALHDALAAAIPVAATILGVSMRRIDPDGGAKPPRSAA